MVTWLVPSILRRIPLAVSVSVAPGSARNVTFTPVRMTCSFVIPWNFTNGRPVLTASETFLHGADCVQFVPVPMGSTYATVASEPHEPSGRQAFDVHSA